MPDALQKAIAAVVFALLLIVGSSAYPSLVTKASTPDTVAGGKFGDVSALGLDREQIENATISLQVADRELADEPTAVAELARLSMITSALGESNLKVVPNAQGSGYCGVYQAHPNNIPCDDTEEQATRFLIGGKGFQAGGAIHQATVGPDQTPGTIATKVEASGKPGSWYDVNPNGGRAKAALIIAAWIAGEGVLTDEELAPIALPEIDGPLTPKEVVDRVILPQVREIGIRLTAAEVVAANERHSVNTTSGNVSEHKGPPTVAWAADISDAWVSTVGSPKMTEVAEWLVKAFGIPWSRNGQAANADATLGPCRFRFQLIYLSNVGGNHFNHVHIGVKALGCRRG